MTNNAGETVNKIRDKKIRLVDGFFVSESYPKFLTVSTVVKCGSVQYAELVFSASTYSSFERTEPGVARQQELFPVQPERPLVLAERMIGELFVAWVGRS
jgi:hypothetical protein